MVNGNRDASGTKLIDFGGFSHINKLYIAQNLSVSTIDEYHGIIGALAEQSM